MVNEPRVPPEDPLAAEFRLRPERPPVTRLSRKVLATLGGVASIAILGALVFALRHWSRKRPAAPMGARAHKPEVIEGEFVVLRQTRHAAR